MSFEAIRSPKDILELQNNIESIFVANVLERRRLAIGEALSKAKHVKDIPKLININVAVNNGFDFIWQQGLFAGIRHAENEIDQQVNKSSNFSLSYGFSEILEFAKKRRSKEEIRTEKIQREVAEIDGQIERSAAILRQNNDSIDHIIAARNQKDIGKLTDEDRQDYRDELTSEIQEAITRRERLLGEVQVLASGATDTAEQKKKKSNLTDNLPEEPQVDTEEDKRRKELRREQARLRRAWERRDKTFEKIKKAQSNLSNAERSQDLHDLAMARLGITTQREIANTLSNRYSALATGEMFSQVYLKERQKVLAKKETLIVQEDVKNRVARFVEEYKTETNQKNLLKDLGDMYRGIDRTQYSVMLENLKQKRERLRKNNELTPDELFPLQTELAENQEDIESVIAEIRKRRRRGQEVSQDDINFLAELREQRTSLRRREKDLRLKINKEEDRIESAIGKSEEKSSQLQSELTSLGNLLDSDNRKKIFDEVYPNLSKNERTDDMFAQAKKLLRKRIRDKRSTAKQFDKELSRKKRQLANGDFKVSRTKGKTTTLSNEEQVEIARLLQLKTIAEREKLRKPMTSAALEKLRERLKRRKDVFGDETAAQSATRLAATEVSAAYNLGRLQVFLSKGIRYVQVISTIDDKRSEFCKSLHGRVFLLEDVLTQTMFAKKFPNTRKESDDPINKIINPGGIWVFPAHPYCRSYYQPVYLKEDEVKIKQDIRSEQLREELITETQIEKEGLKGINRLQREHWEKKKDLVNKTKVANKLFSTGLSFLLRRLRQDKIADFTVNDIKKNDSELMAALLGGAAALTATSMVYFFLKGNLSSAVTDYAQHVMSDIYEGGKEFLAGMNKQQAAKVVSDIAKEIKSLPPSVLEELRIPLDLDKLEVPEFEIDKLTKRGEAGFGLAVEGIPVDEAVESLLTNNQLRVDSGKAFKNKIYKEILNKTTNEASFLRRSGLDLINEGLGEIGVVGDINDIQGFRAWPLGIKQEPSLVYIQPKPGKGKEFPVGAKKFNEILGNKGFGKKLDNIGDRAKQLKTVLQDLEESLDSKDVINKSRIRKTLNELDSLARLSNKLKGAKAAPLLSRTAKALDEVFDADILTNQKLADFNTAINNISDAGNAVIQEVAEFIPPDKVMNLVAENITDLSELKFVEEVLDAAIDNMQSRFILTRQKGFDVRPLQDLKDLGDSLIKLEEVQVDLTNTSAQLEFQPTLDRINEVVKREVSVEYTKLLKQKLEVSRRIEKLEQ